MKPTRLLAIGLFALSALGLTGTAMAAPQSAPLAALGFDPHVLATLDALFGSADDSKASDSVTQPATTPADAPNCEPHPGRGKTTVGHPHAAVDDGHDGGSGPGLPAASPRASGLSWQSLLPGSIQ